MTAHPALLLALLLDGLGLLLLLNAALAALRLLPDWDPGSASRAQLRRELQGERASLAGRAGLVLHLLASAVLLVAVSGLLPERVPGAMCGTGVLQAMGAAGQRSLWLRGLALAGLALWHAVDRLDRSQPRAPLTPVSARLLLLATPLGAVASLSSFRALAALDLHRPVDCCAAVYDRFETRAAATSWLGVTDEVWVGAMIGGAVVVAGLALWLRLRPARAQRRGLALLLLSAIWIPVAGVTLVRVLAAYHYGVLQHHCPWCLFLPAHSAVGVPLFGALALMGLEAGATALVPALARQDPALEAEARARLRAASLRYLLALGVMLGLSLGPALLWRLRHGVWMG